LSQTFIGWNPLIYRLRSRTAIVYWSASGNVLVNICQAGQFRHIREDAGTTWPPSFIAAFIMNIALLGDLKYLIQSVFQ